MIRNYDGHNVVNYVYSLHRFETLRRCRLLGQCPRLLCTISAASLLLTRPPRTVYGSTSRCSLLGRLVCCYHICKAKLASCTSCTGARAAAAFLAASSAATISAKLNSPSCLVREHEPLQPFGRLGCCYHICKATRPPALVYGSTSRCSFLGRLVCCYHICKAKLALLHLVYGSTSCCSLLGRLVALPYLQS